MAAETGLTISRLVLDNLPQMVAAVDEGRAELLLLIRLIKEVAHFNISQ
ncbi:hypothetical protein [Solemya pervernicosa gill symbiont]|nr:hypothetical protein [Solemya pervernicosa gill symbiont]